MQNPIVAFSQRALARRASLLQRLHCRRRHNQRRSFLAGVHAILATVLLVFLVLATMHRGVHSNATRHTCFGASANPVAEVVAAQEETLADKALSAADRALFANVTGAR